MPSYNDMSTSKRFSCGAYLIIEGRSPTKLLRFHAGIFREDGHSSNAIHWLLGFSFHQKYFWNKNYLLTLTPDLVLSSCCLLNHIWDCARDSCDHTASGNTWSGLRARNTLSTSWADRGQAERVSHDQRCSNLSSPSLITNSGPASLASIIVSSQLPIYCYWGSVKFMRVNSTQPTPHTSHSHNTTISTHLKKKSLRKNSLHVAMLSEDLRLNQ